MLIRNGHEAMIEHSFLSVKFTVDRGVSHELVRHRIASFAQESTRYCNYAKDKFGAECAFIDLEPGIMLDNKMKKMSGEEIALVMAEWTSAMEDAERHYMRLLELGATPQIARAVLPNSTKTEITVSANYREWRNFFKLRVPADVHPQMREVTIPLLRELKGMIPVIFDDIEC
jgi:thymidylate synthase (FAD)